MAFGSKYVVEEDENDWEPSSTVWRIDKDGNKEIVGWIGGEPEDNNSYRTYSWIERALNEAYQNGYKDGVNDEYCRLRDKV